MYTVYEGLLGYQIQLHVQCILIILKSSDTTTRTLYTCIKESQIIWYKVMLIVYKGFTELPFSNHIVRKSEEENNHFKKHDFKVVMKV